MKNDLSQLGPARNGWYSGAAEGLTKLSVAGVCDVRINANEHQSEIVTRIFANPPEKRWYATVHQDGEAFSAYGHTATEAQQGALDLAKASR